MKIELPFPSSILAGHTDGKGRWKKVAVTKAHREAAKLAAEAAQLTVPETGDIPITVRFVPANNRGDRVNYPNRLKPYFDGIADALGVNDKRFHPFYIFAEVEAPGRVEFYVG